MLVIVTATLRDVPASTSSTLVGENEHVGFARLTCLLSGVRGFESLLLVYMIKSPGWAVHGPAVNSESESF